VPFAVARQLHEQACRLMQACLALALQQGPITKPNKCQRVLQAAAVEPVTKLNQPPNVCCKLLQWKYKRQAAETLEGEAEEYLVAVDIAFVMSCLDEVVGTPFDDKMQR